MNAVRACSEVLYGVKWYTVRLQPGAAGAPGERGEQSAVGIGEPSPRGGVSGKPGEPVRDTVKDSRAECVPY